MLDQSTDRMWYVIGAVIVGAAIILLMNGTFPNLFASVGETFQGKTEEVTQVTDGIQPAMKPVIDDDQRHLRIVSASFVSTNPVSGMTSDGDIYDVSAYKKAVDESTLLDYSLQSDKVHKRGLELFVFNADNTLEFNQLYDVYGHPASAADLAVKLRSITDETKLLILVSGDSLADTYNYRLMNGLPEAMFDIGASADVFGTLAYRESYVLIGKPNMGHGNGYEQTAPSDKVVDFEINIFNGEYTLVQ